MTASEINTPLPESNEFAERMVLGAALDNTADLTTALTLDPSEFTPGKLRTVHTAIHTVHRRGEPVNPHTVYDELARAGHPEAGSFVHTLYRDAIPGGVDTYAALIGAASDTRRMIADAQRIAQLAGAEPGDERTAYLLDLALGIVDRIGGTGTPDVQALKHDREVQTEAKKLRARKEAARLVEREQRGAHAIPPPIFTGTDFLAQPESPATYRLDQLWPTGGRILLAAQYKAGKSTMVGNVIRSLVDAEPFLDHYTVTRQARRVTLIDNELDRDMLRRWLREQGIQRAEGFGILALRGHLSTFDILDPATRTYWAGALRDLGTEICIIDCLRPILDAFGLDENREAGRLLTAIDELLGEAGVPEALIVHHMGHTGERSRGDSRLRDWPDVEWRLVRQDPDDPASPRYFSAFGRDVDVPETSLIYDPDRRRLIQASGDRRQAAAHIVVPALLELLAEHPSGLSGRQIEKELTDVGHTQKAIRQALTVAHNDGQTITFAGPRRSTLHTLRKS